MPSSKKTSGLQALARLVLCAAGSLSLLTSVANAESTFAKDPSAVSDLSAVTLALGGMHCAGCSLKIRKALQSIKGVTKLEDGATKKHLVVTFEPAKTSTAALIKKIEDLGYQATVVD